MSLPMAIYNVLILKRCGVFITKLCCNFMNSETFSIRKIEHKSWTACCRIFQSIETIMYWSECMKTMSDDNVSVLCGRSQLPKSHFENVNHQWICALCNFASFSRSSHTSRILTLNIILWDKSLIVYWKWLNCLARWFFRN